jgi:hypothetical protein
MGRETQPLRIAPAWSEGFLMRKPQIIIEVRVNVALCLFGVAAIIKALM